MISGMCGVGGEKTGSPGRALEGPTKEPWKVQLNTNM